MNDMETDPQLLEFVQKLIKDEVERQLMMEKRRLLGIIDKKIFCTTHDMKATLILRSIKEWANSNPKPQK